HTPKMSQGPTLFSCGVMENDRWRDLSRKCPLQLEQPGASIWDCLSDKGEEGTRWPREAATACSVTNLIRDLSLSDPHGNPSAPPSKRQCRSLSFSDEMSGCGTSWRPLGSKVWTPVEKRRCYSGGSMPRYSGGAAATTMQRSSSFSLPSRSHPLCAEHPALGGRTGCHPGRPATGGHRGERLDIQRSLSCSQERFSCSEDGPPSASSTPASTPELCRRATGLSRSRSQPCVLNDKKVGVKRRRPEEVQEQRPSLDLAKMTQNRQTFNSLTCLSGVADGGSPRPPGPAEVMPGRTPACTPIPEPPRSRHGDHGTSRDDLSCEEEEDRAGWRGGGTATESLFQLDGELDIEQIENN
ncbi:FA53B protein, partial [Grallaria varia]|nr:FA53B protein [Grallaria varia]